MDVRLSAEELMPLNCGVGEDSFFFFNCSGFCHTLK